MTEPVSPDTRRRSAAPLNISLLRPTGDVHFQLWESFVVGSGEFAVGERARRAAGRATWVSKETPGLNGRQPWQDGPYDVVVSLDFVVLPLLVAMGAARVLPCRRYERYQRDGSPTWCDCAPLLWRCACSGVD